MSSTAFSITHPVEPRPRPWRALAALALATGLGAGLGMTSALPVAVNRLLVLTTVLMGAVGVRALLASAALRLGIGPGVSLSLDGGRGPVPVTVRAGWVIAQRWLGLELRDGDGRAFRVWLARTDLEPVVWRHLCVRLRWTRIT
jgi:hypothetical protein